MLSPSFPRRRESSDLIIIPRSGQNRGIAPLCVACSIVWIPACVGMTKCIAGGGEVCLAG